MGTIALPSVRCTATDGNATQHAAQIELDLCGMLRPSLYCDAVCVNAAVEINVLVPRTAPYVV